MELKLEIDAGLGTTLPLSMLMEGSGIRELAEWASVQLAGSSAQPSETPRRRCQRSEQSIALARAAIALVRASVHAQRRRLPYYRGRDGPRGAGHQRLPTGVTSRHRPPRRIAHNLRRRRRKARRYASSMRASSSAARTNGSRSKTSRGRDDAELEQKLVELARRSFRPGERAALSGPSPEPIGVRARCSPGRSPHHRRLLVDRRARRRPREGVRRGAAQVAPPSCPFSRDQATPTSRAGSTRWSAGAEGRAALGLLAATARGPLPVLDLPTDFARPAVQSYGARSSTSTSIRH